MLTVDQTANDGELKFRISVGSPMASLVLTDSSQLTSDTQHLESHGAFDRVSTPDLLSGTLPLCGKRGWASAESYRLYDSVSGQYRY
uniref:Uncharacterized protein n=1 Tax=Timema tahoe TaxID=61484 RepID=A0A7R9NUN8_9NEOP|nr:unnamed protein product [Timema tahoe]